MKKLGLAMVALGGALALVALPRADPGPELDFTAQVFVVKSDGSGLRQLTHGGQRKSSPTWSPDARRLAYAGGGPLHVFTVATGKDRVVRRTQHNPAYQSLLWSPRRQELLYAFRTGADERGRGNLATLGADGSRFRLLAAWRQGGFDSGDPVWSPSGERIAYLRERPRRGPPPPGPVVALSGPVNVAVVGRRGGAGRTIELRGNEHEPRWSPNGRSILFVRTVRRSGHELWTMSPRGRTRRRVGPPLVHVVSGDWSPDGTRIAFTGHTDTGARQQALWVMHAARGAVPRMAAAESDASAWSPAEDLIAFADYAGNLRVTAPDGSEQRTLATFATDTEFRYLTWSPDGRRLAFTAEKRRPSD